MTGGKKTNKGRRNGRTAKINTTATKERKQKEEAGKTTKGGSGKENKRREVAKKTIKGGRGASPTTS